jgi:glycosyltransferase involved in cell wall biosynthesis
MSYIRWLSISTELSLLGHDVDIATGCETATWRPGIVSLGPRLRQVPLNRVRWEDYDLVKTVYQRGFETLEKFGGLSHPFIVARMSGVVDQYDREGIYFAGERRRWLYAIQEKMSRHSRYVSLTTEPAKQLWLERFGDKNGILMVPGATATEVPAAKKDPYPAGETYRCLFAGNVFDRVSQKDVNEHLTRSLNTLGQMLQQKKIRLFVMGSGDISGINPDYVTHLGAIPYEESWDYFHFASVGTALQWGSHPNQNELTKIYYYLRLGLPVVCESGFPNEPLISDTGMGYVVPNGDLAQMAERIEQAARRDDWPAEEASRWMSAHHTWRNRAESYHRILQDQELPSKPKGLFRRLADRLIPPAQ